MVYCCSLETFKRLSGWNMGWITPSKDDVATGYTITPGKEFNLTMKDMCSPDMKVTFRPNKKDPRYDDLVGIYAGKEAFRYKQIK